MRKKKKTQDLPNKDLRHTSLPFYQLDRETFWMMIDAGLLSAPSALYFYSTLNCDLDTGQGHRIEYDTVAPLLGFHSATIYNAANLLEEAGLIDRADSGGYTPKLPRVKHQQQIVKRQREVKRERNFYVELDKRIVAVMKELNEKLDLPRIWLEHDGLCRDRQPRKRNKFIPEYDKTNP